MDGAPPNSSMVSSMVARPHLYMSNAGTIFLAVRYLVRGTHQHRKGEGCLCYAQGKKKK